MFIGKAELGLGLPGVPRGVRFHHEDDSNIPLNLACALLKPFGLRELVATADRVLQVAADTGKTLQDK